MALQVSHLQPVPEEHELQVYQVMAQQAASSKLYRGIGDESGLLTIMLSAREMGIPPMGAINGGLNLIQGKVEISARMMTALIRKAGHSILVTESTDEICTVKGKRADNGDEMVCSFSIEEAKRAGLVKSGGGWSKHPSDMLFARAISRLSRRLFSDIIGIGYVEGEIPVKTTKKKASNYIEKEEEIKEAEVVDTGNLIKDFLKTKPQAKRKAWEKYLRTVCSKLEWEVEKAIQEFEKDPESTQEKFEKWENSSQAT